MEAGWLAGWLAYKANFALPLQRDGCEQVHRMGAGWLTEVAARCGADFPGSCGCGLRTAGCGAAANYSGESRGAAR